MYRVQLFGEIALFQHDKPCLLPTGVRSRSILARLLLSNSDELNRSYLAGLIWPDSEESQARTNLRREIHQLRESHPLYKSCIRSSRQAIQWQWPGQYELDVEQFLAAHGAFHNNHPQQETLSAGLQALANYTGDFMASHEDSWIVERREYLMQLRINLAENVLSLQNALGLHSDATCLASELVTKEPLRESLYVELMKAQIALGNPALALSTYHHCASILKQELSVQPNATLESLYRSLISNPDVNSRQTAQYNSEDCAHHRVTFVGRENELHEFKQSLENTKHSVQLILVSGEAGIGKTRFVSEALRQAESKGYCVIRSTCHAAAGDLALSVIHDWFKNSYYQNQFARLDSWWQSVIQDTIPAFDRRRGRNSGRIDANRASHSRQTQFEALTRMIGSDQVIGEKPRPPLLFIDDLQWIDNDFIAFLAYFFSRHKGSPITLVATKRSEDDGSDNTLKGLLRQLELKDQLVSMPLSALNFSESVSLARQLMRAHNMGDRSAESLSRLCTWSQGNPFYLTETILHGTAPSTRSTLDTSEELAIAPKITTIVKERLYTLNDLAQQLLLHASVIGRSFSVTLLHELKVCERQRYTDLLDQLWRQNFIREVGKGHYDFSHDCLREISYSLLSVPQKRAMHAAVADALQRLHSQNSQDVAGQIAVNLSLAAEEQRALPWYLWAIEHALPKLNCHEVLKYIEPCLATLDQSENSVSNTRIRLQLLHHKSSMLSLIDGFGGARERIVCDEIEKLDPLIDDQALQFTSLSRIRVHSSFAGRIAHAQSCVERQLKIAEQINDPLLRLEAHRSLVFVHYQQGQFARMSEQARLGESVIVQLEESGSMRTETPLWTASMLRLMHAFALYTMGRPVHADAVIDQCRHYAQSLGDDEHVVGLVHLWMLKLHMLRREWNKASAVSTVLKEIGERTALIKLSSMGQFGYGYTLANTGDLPDGARHMREAISLLEQHGEDQPLINWYVDIAFVCMKMQQFEEARCYLEKSANMEQVSGIASATAPRLSAEAVLMAESNVSAEHVLERHAAAIAAAEQQQAVHYQIMALTRELDYREAAGLHCKSKLEKLTRLLNVQGNRGTKQHNSETPSRQMQY